MTLIKSISGIRGTIGGAVGENLTPVDIVKFTSAYATYIRGVSDASCASGAAATHDGRRIKIVVGRDARISGPMVERLVHGTLMGCGADVVDLGLCTTPGVELAVVHYAADGGIILTASHNPRQWNALKLLDAKGEFLSATAGAKILRMAEAEDLHYATVDELGRVVESADFTPQHIAAVLALPLVDKKAIRKRRFKVVVDAVNSVGGLAIPALLKELGCEVVCLNCEPDGEFAHNPEPLPENLTEISKVVVREGADLGVVVDPDVDRLALVMENGGMFGEEYTLVAVADYVLGAGKADYVLGARKAISGSGSGSGTNCSGYGGNTVSNLSSTRALRDITEKHGGHYHSSAVGEVNVVARMKETGAAIGGEGNGGVIYPALHYGRDALVGVALLLTHLAHSGLSMSALRATYPDYHISKNKIELTEGVDVDAILCAVKERYSGPEMAGAEGVENITDIDGVKIGFGPRHSSKGGWVHLRKSNTEPIIRIYAEARDKAGADALAEQFIAEIRRMG